MVLLPKRKVHTPICSITSPLELLVPLTYALMEYHRCHFLSQENFPIGRLDKPSQGLILPQMMVTLSTKSYVLEIIMKRNTSSLSIRTLQISFTKMRQGVPILDTVTRPCTVTKINKNVFKIIQLKD